MTTTLSSRHRPPERATSPNTLLHQDVRSSGHASTRTTQFYNRLLEEISLDEIERIHI
ncbi:MAG: hypothetical protein OXE86_13370 [Alphaproteobacteria bacterium]|nr:hypothetical protein [Alphaproteobacteria bacterium]